MRSNEVVKPARARAVLASAAALAVSALATVPAARAQSLTPLSGFGTNGWRAPGQVLAGDTAGSATAGVYNYLGTGNNERGFAYNPATGNLILVSRSSAGNGIRVLDGKTGTDLGALNQGSGVITGGTFAINAVGVADDGAIFVGNLTTASNSSPLKVYRWANEAAPAPTTFASAATAFSARLGDSLDVIGSGAGTRVVAGFAGTTGFVRYDNAGAMTVVNPLSGATSGAFRLGLSFGQSADEVFGKQTSGAVNRATNSGAAWSVQTGNTASAGDAPLDYARFGGTAYLAAIDANNSAVRAYTVSDTTFLNQVTSNVTTTSGTLAGNGNATGNVKFGQTNAAAGSAILYAMSSNQGIQAMIFASREYRSTWQNPAGGNYGYFGDSADWSSGVPHGASATAVFGNVAGAPASVAVNLDNSVVTNGVEFDATSSYTVSGTGSLRLANKPTSPIASAIAPAITVRSGSHRVTAPVVLANTTNANIATGATVDFRRLDGSTSGAGLNVGPGDTGTSGGTLVVSELLAVNAVGFSGTTTRLDLRTGGAVLFGQGLESVRGQVGIWFANGVRGGVGLGSSSATSAANTMLAVVPNSDPTTPSSKYFNSFRGVALASTDVLVVYTYMGDTNLDGALDGKDLADLLEGFSTGATGWQNGDLNYDNTVNALDVGLWNTAFAQYQANPVPIATGLEGPGLPGHGAVPEPTALGLLLPAGALLGRRRRA